jgi:predicted nucleic acid-binding Zn ribbon protein
LGRQKKEKMSIPRHAHCLICGMTIPENETFCSSKCRDEYEKTMKRQKYLRLSALIPLIGVTILFILLLLVGK